MLPEDTRETPVSTEATEHRYDWWLWAGQDYSAQTVRPIGWEYAETQTHTNTNLTQLLLGGLIYEGILVQSVGDVAVEGAWLHGHAVHAGEGPVSDVESLQHPEAWEGMETGAMLSARKQQYRLIAKQTSILVKPTTSVGY